MQVSKARDGSRFRAGQNGPNVRVEESILMFYNPCEKDRGGIVPRSRLKRFKMHNPRKVRRYDCVEVGDVETSGVQASPGTNISASLLSVISIVPGRN